MKIKPTPQSFLLLALYIGTTTATIAAKSTNSEIKPVPSIENTDIDKHHHDSMSNKSEHNQFLTETDQSSNQSRGQHDHENKEISSITEQGSVTELHAHDSNNKLIITPLNQNMNREEINQPPHKSHDHTHS